MEMSVAQRNILEYWQRHRQANPRTLPSRSDMDVRDLGKSMAYVVVFDLLTDPPDFRYRLVGTAVTENTFGDYTGKRLTEMEGKGPGSKLWGFLDHVRSSRDYLFEEVPYVGPKAMYLRSTLLFLPLASDHQTTDKIFLVSNFISKAIGLAP